MTTKGNKKILNDYFPSEKKLRKKIVDKMSDEIKNQNIKLNISLEELYLVIDEAITNAMEHGNKWNPDKKTHVEISSDTENLNIKVTDEGKGFNTDDIYLYQKDKDKFSTRGRGIYIIYQFCEPTWNKKGNVIILKIKKKA